MHGQPAKRSGSWMLAEPAAPPIVSECRVFVLDAVTLLEVDAACRKSRLRLFNISSLEHAKLTHSHSSGERQGRFLISTRTRGLGL
jgi:hypothetical protein